MSATMWSITASTAFLRCVCAMLRCFHSVIILCYATRVKSVHRHAAKHWLFRRQLRPSLMHQGVAVFSTYLLSCSLNFSSLFARFPSLCFRVPFRYRSSLSVGCRAPPSTRSRASRPRRINGYARCVSAFRARILFRFALFLARSGRITKLCSWKQFETVDTLQSKLSHVYAERD